MKPKTNTITFRTTDKEKARLQKQAASKAITLSKFIQNALTSKAKLAKQKKAKDKVLMQFEQNQKINQSILNPEPLTPEQKLKIANAAVAKVFRENQETWEQQQAAKQQTPLKK